MLFKIDGNDTSTGQVCSVEMLADSIAEVERKAQDAGIEVEQISKLDLKGRLRTQDRRDARARRFRHSRKLINTTDGEVESIWNKPGTVPLTIALGVVLGLWGFMLSVLLVLAILDINLVSR